MSDSKPVAVDQQTDGAGNMDRDRRAFLASCGRFAAITPPAVVVLLSTTLSSKAITRSGGTPVPTPVWPPRP